MNDEKQKKKEFKDYTPEETRAWIKEMERVYRPFIEPEDYIPVELSDRKVVCQKDGTWKETEAK